jgi:hypothetical protein
MAFDKDVREGGKGGTLGRSNMAYWGTDDEAKAAGRFARRAADRDVVAECLADAREPEHRIRPRAKETPR